MQISKTKDPRVKPGGEERIAYPVPFSDTRREVLIPKANRGMSNLNINQTCLQDVLRQYIANNFHSLCNVFLLLIRISIVHLLENLCTLRSSNPDMLARF